MKQKCAQKAFEMIQDKKVVGGEEARPLPS